MQADNRNIEWRDVVGYEGFYKVSSDGVVKSVERVVVTKDGKSFHYKEKCLKPYNGHGGYEWVFLSRGCKTKGYSVHRLVAIAFCEGDTSLTVNHKNFDRTDNRADNLEFISRGDNIRYSVKYGRYDGCVEGRRERARKLDDTKIKEIKSLLRTNISQTAIAKIFNVDESLIRLIKKGILWADV